ncbi:hypothetical protein J6590_020847 [Homalodisca vitripennis]|nr:hypothetical protein J6590_020847 [Homalodisca vitripennis]
MEIGNLQHGSCRGFVPQMRYHPQTRGDPIAPSLHGRNGRTASAWYRNTRSDSFLRYPALTLGLRKGSFECGTIIDTEVLQSSRVSCYNNFFVCFAPTERLVWWPNGRGISRCARQRQMAGYVMVGSYDKTGGRVEPPFFPPRGEAVRNAGKRNRAIRQREREGILCTKEHNRIFKEQCGILKCLTV